MPHPSTSGIADFQALAWYVDHGVTEALCETPQDRTKIEESPPPLTQSSAPGMAGMMQRHEAQGAPEPQASRFLGKSDAYEEAVKLAAQANTLEELFNAIHEFDGLAIKKTAYNTVFADGNPKANIMLVGEAPGADEDRQGKPFVGVSGQLLDKILSCIGLDRTEENPEKSVYISNVINWRPPGNRTPNEAETHVSLPFIERHIQLVKPKILILCGGIAAKSLLGSNNSISRLRKTWHDYKPQTEALKQGAESIPAIATYHPSYLLRTPSQKKAVWQDMLEIAEKINKFT